MDREYREDCGACYVERDDELIDIVPYPHEVWVAGCSKNHLGKRMAERARLMTDREINGRLLAPRSLDDFPAMRAKETPDAR